MIMKSISSGKSKMLQASSEVRSSKTACIVFAVLLALVVVPVPQMAIEVLGMRGGLMRSGRGPLSLHPQLFGLGHWPAGPQAPTKEIFMRYGRSVPIPLVPTAEHPQQQHFLPLMATDGEVLGSAPAIDSFHSRFWTVPIGYVWEQHMKRNQRMGSPGSSFLGHSHHWQQPLSRALFESSGGAGAGEQAEAPAVREQRSFSETAAGDDLEADDMLRFGRRKR